MNILELYKYKSAEEVIELGLDEAIKRKKVLIKQNHPDNGGDGNKIDEIKEAFDKIVDIIAKFDKADNKIISVEELEYLYKEGIGKNELFNDNYSVRINAEIYLDGEKYGEVERIFKIAYDKRYRLEYNVSGNAGSDIGVRIGNKEKLVREAKFKNVIRVELDEITVDLVVYLA